MSFEVLDSSEEQTGERPLFLTVVCILSFIGSGFSIMVYMLILFGVQTLLDAIPNMSELLNSGAKYYFVLAVLIYLVSLFGAFKMWKLKKNGFYIYLFACLASVLMPLLWGYAMPGIETLVFVGLFIGLYGLNLKHMR
jgi:hypothetical protein